MTQDSLFQALGGLPGVQRLAEAWHRRVLADEIVAHAFSHGYHPAHTERLAAYWSEAWGGPPLYTSALGDESRVVRMHSGNGEHDEMDRRAVACFAQALDDVGVQDPGLRQALCGYFAWATHERMTAYPRSPRDVPAGLQIVRWGWHGRLRPSDGLTQAPTIQPSSGSTSAGQP